MKDFCSTQHIHTNGRFVDFFSTSVFFLKQFLGKWFEIARTSNPNQEGDCAAFDFTSGNNGIDVQYTAVRSNFFEEATGMMTQEGDTAKFKMTISSFEERK